MAKSFTCSDVGVNCNWSATAEDENDLLNQIKEHAKDVHNFNEIPPDLYAKVKSAIK